MTTRNARDKTWQHLQRKASPPTVEPPSEQENGGQREATVWGWGGSQWWVSNRKYLYNGDTGQRIPIQIHIHTRSFMLCSFIRSFLSQARTHTTIYPTFQFNLFHFGCVDISVPSFFTKYYLQHLSIAFRMVWCGMVRYFIRSPIRWSLVCSFAWLAGPSLSRTHTHGGECVNFQPFFPIFNGSLRAWLDIRFGVWGICGVANIRLQCTHCAWKTTGDAIVQPAQHRKCKTWIVEKEAMRRCERKKIDFTQTIEHLHKIFIKYINVWMHEYTTWCPFFVHIPMPATQHCCCCRHRAKCRSCHNLYIINSEKSNSTNQI